MFESNVPPNLPVEEKKVEDIFAPTESVKSAPPQIPGTEAGAPRETPRTGFKRVLLILGGALILVLVFGGVYTVLRKSADKPQTLSPEATTLAPEASPTVEIAPTPEEALVSPDEVTVPAREAIAEPLSPTDSDGDGLTDDEELGLGTNLESADTDGDELTDREEVRVYRSDPLNSDTDGDGYLDGHEVKSGYSPTGPGKLLPPIPPQQ